MARRKHYNYYDNDFQATALALIEVKGSGRITRYSRSHALSLVGRAAASGLDWFRAADRLRRRLNWTLGNTKEGFMDIDSKIKNAEEQLRQAMLTSDVEALDQLLSPDLIFTNHLGQCLGKEADLEAHKTGALSITELEPSEQQIALVSGDTAVVSVRVGLAGTYAGQAAGGDFRFTRVWAQAPSGRWQVVAAHACMVA